MADIEDVIKRVIDESWLKYDKRRNGYLDKKETRQLLEASFGYLENSLDIQNDDFENIFAGFDRDGSGTISKEEMADFIKRVAGLGKSGSNNDYNYADHSSAESVNAAGKFKRALMGNIDKKGIFAKQLANAFIQKAAEIIDNEVTCKEHRG